MFRQVRIDERQWDLQRIFWREHPDDPLQEYWLSVVTYGMTSSGFNAVRAMQQCAIDNQQTYPRAYEAIQRNFYVDDMLTGAESEDEAISLGREIVASLGAGGFELDKFMSSSRRVLSELRKKEDNQTELTFPKEYETSILGLSWDPINDDILFKVHHGANVVKSTKRAVVSAIAKLYDPNGYLAPVIISAKILIQDLWRSGVQWDENIPAALVPVWDNFQEQLAHLTLVRLPRWLGCETGANLQLHGFSDASARAYAAVIYLRSTSSDGTTRCVIIASKTRVAPLKTITIPKLELCAANLLCRLMAQVVNALGLQHVPITYWSDSMVVLHWITKVPAELKTFVANRIASIQELTGSRPWKHVASGDNPADLGSRGIPAVQLVRSNLWWQGPQWLSQPEHNWPNTQLYLTAREREKAFAANKIVAVASLVPPKSSELSINGVSLLERNSTLQRVLRITAYVIKFVRLVTKTREKTGRGLTTAMERNDALEYWAKSTQGAAYPQEIGLIRNGRPVDSSSSIHTLRPFLDSNGVLRVYGRLQESALAYENIHPIILPARSKLTELLLKEAHIRTQHGGVQLCMQYVREGFWIPSLRQVLKSVIARCMKCFRQKQRVAEQLMGNLPRDRVRPTRAFKHSGVDYAGPVQTKARAGRSKIIEKGYIAVFVCLVTRAIHLEPVTNQTTDAFLAAFHRFTGRRGACSVLWSDNATTFVGADKELRGRAEQWRTSLPVEQISAMGTEWKFIAPGAPHTGGIWEAGVKSMKHHLRRVMGNQIFTFETLATTLVLIEACLNSRPLTALTDDPDDLNALTPGHFLIGEQIVQPLTTDFSEVPQNRLKLWSVIYQMQQHFWKRWSKEYINTLQQRCKWSQDRENLKAGSLVLIKQDNLPPTLWLLGRISAVHMGKDGLVRSAEIKTEHSTLVRPIQKLCVLPIDQCDTSN